MGIGTGIKSLIEKHYNGVYRVKVKDKDVSYDAWIRGKEMPLERFDMSVDIDKTKTAPILSYATHYGATTVRILPFSAVTPGFSVKPCLEDVIIFVDGELTDKAIPLIVQKFNKNQECNVIYGDEDIAETFDIEAGRYGQSVPGSRREPYFKPDWSPNKFLSHFYFCNMVALRRSAFRDVDWDVKESGAQGIYKMLLNYVFSNEHNFRKSVIHIDEILTHSTSYDNNYLVCEGVEAISLKARVRSYGPIGYNMLNKTMITVVIPSKDNPTMLRRCVESLMDCCPGSIILQIFVVDNGSNDENHEIIQDMSLELGFTYEYRPMDFNFARMCNLGAALGSGEYILLLNDDVYFTQPYVLENMINEVSYQFTGAVGIKLLYPDSQMIQHAGVINNRIGPVHKLQFCDDSVNYYYGFNKYPQNVMAVTGACLLVRRDIYEKLNGLNEGFRVAFNDVDFCYRLIEEGYFNVSCNQVYGCHAESVSRGKDTDTESLKRLLHEKDLLYEEHPVFRGIDPFFNKYLQTNHLETRIAPATSDEPASKGQIQKINLENVREEACINLNVEYSGKVSDFSPEYSLNEKTVLFEGFSFVMGSDNALYKRMLLLKGDSGCYGIDISDSTLRSDVSDNCPDQINVSLSGFNVVADVSNLPLGNYRIGMLCIKRFSKEKLFCFSNRELVVK